MKIKSVLLLLILSGVSWTTYAQEFRIKAVELSSGLVTLYYDLTDTTRDRTYTVWVYSSRDNFMQPLTKITGDAGLEVKPGENHRIVWNAREELGGTFTGDVEFEIRGRVYIPFIRFQGLEKSRKRTVPFLVKWSGGTQQNILNFQLYHHDKLVYTFPNIPNTHEYKLVIPASVKPGKEFHLKVSDTRNRDQEVISSTFQIRRKIPLVIKAVPVLGIGLLGYFLANHNENKALEGPPGVPGTK